MLRPDVSGTNGMWVKKHLFVAAALIASGSVHAQVGDAAAADPDASFFLDAKHRVSLGIAEQAATGGLRATAEGFDPVELQIGDLDVDDPDYSYYLDYRYRFKPRWVVVAGAFGFRDTGVRRAERDFNFDGVEFTAGAELSTSFEVDAYLVDVMYAVHRGQRSELLLGGGIHALDLGASIGARIEINDQSREFRQSGTTLLAPVPNLRAAGTWVLSERFALHGIAGWLSANVEDFSGDFLYGHVRLAYAVTHQLSLALGYQRTDIDITQQRSRAEINYDINLEGFTATVAYSF